MLKKPRVGAVISVCALGLSVGGLVFLQTSVSGPAARSAVSARGSGSFERDKVLFSEAHIADCLGAGSA
jgi:hypothetical protein